MQVYK